MEIKINSRPEPDDYFRFSLNHAKKRLILVPAIAFGIVSIIYLIIFIRLGTYYWPSELTVYYVAFVAFVAVVLPLLNVGMIKLASSRQYRTSKHPGMEITVNEEGLQTHSELGENRVPWSHVHRVTEAKTGVYFYMSSAQAVVFPTRCFTPEQYAQLHELCKRHMPPKRNRLKYRP